MIKLFFWVSALLAAVFTVLINMGDSDHPDASHGAGHVKLTSINMLLSDASLAQDEINGDAMAVDRHVSKRRQKFPGPDLQPPPEGVVAVHSDTGSADRVVLYVTGDRVNFRAGPSTDHQVIGALDRGMTVLAVGPVDAEWVKIRTTGGTSGYMSGRFLSRESL